jgi:hypothetical protein
MQSRLHEGAPQARKRGFDMTNDFTERLSGMATWGEFLRTAGAVAANHQSPIHRAHALRDIQALGNCWTQNLSIEKSSLAEAISSSIAALVGASSPDARTAIAGAIRDLVAVARVTQTLT